MSQWVSVFPVLFDVQIELEGSVACLIVYTTGWFS